MELAMPRSVKFLQVCNTGTPVQKRAVDVAQSHPGGMTQPGGQSCAEPNLTTKHQQTSHRGVDKHRSAISVFCLLDWRTS